MIRFMTLFLLNPILIIAYVSLEIFLYLNVGQNVLKVVSYLSLSGNGTFYSHVILSIFKIFVILLYIFTYFYVNLSFSNF